MVLSMDLLRLKSDPKGFLEDYWVVPGSGYTMGKGPNGYLPLARVLSGQVETTDSKLTLTSPRDRIAYGSLVKEQGDRYQLAFLSHRQLDERQRKNYLPMWFLPWFSDHVTKMKILRPEVLPPGTPDSPIFFTSALSGCSVFVDGPDDSPTVYHGGFSNTRDFTAKPRLTDPSTGTESDSVTHWRLLFGRMSGGSQNFAEVNKQRYLSGGGTYDRMTPDMQAYMQFLKSEHQNEMRISDMKSEGTVMGHRQTDGRWRFFLQESVTIVMYTLRKKKRLFGKARMVDGEQKTFRRPMVLRQIYPARGTVVTWNVTRVVP